MVVSSSALAEPMRITGIDSVHGNVRWQVVNDTVMGGRSESRFVYENGLLQFSGRLNTNGGGFASLRSNRQDWDLSEFSVVRLKVLGDERLFFVTGPVSVCTAISYLGCISTIGTYSLCVPMVEMHPR